MKLELKRTLTTFYNFKPKVLNFDFEFEISGPSLE